MTDFPASLAARQDQSFYSEKPEEKEIKVSTEGGYDVTRPRTTRRPRMTFTTGFTDISHADKLALEDFYNQVRTSAFFAWPRPTDGVPVPVRFMEAPEFKYLHHAGGGHRWTVPSIKLKEV
ncbi:MAG TPA: hypothetical protein VGN75_07525 [Kaistia sp.]|jgi:hypothetical protein|nr:hypothetical protein [Kaistia sp.]